MLKKLKKNLKIVISLVANEWSRISFQASHRRNTNTDEEEEDLGDILLNSPELSSRDGVMMHSITFPSSPLCGHPMCRAWASAVTAGQSPTWHAYSLATGHAGLAPSPVSECRRHLLVMRQRQEKERLSELTGGAVERCMSRR